MYRAVILLCLMAAAQAGDEYKYPNTANGRSAMVHLFEWTWTAIARECENFLGPHGFGAVQISAPNEHRVITSPESWGVQRPWYESYQPISYQLVSRRGNEAEFIDMVERCNAVNVRIYVDAVVNHMCGGDTKSNESCGDSKFDASAYSFPGLYDISQFNVPTGQCPTGDGAVNDYNSKEIVRNCNLVGLLDLRHEFDSVRQNIIGYFNKVIDIGVAGFRIDAAKHMWPNDLQAIFDGTNDLNTKYFPQNTRPFFFQEVIDQDTGEAVTCWDYNEIARVTDFIYGREVSETFKGSRWLGGLEDFGKYNSVKLNNADGVVFVDNHDNQRGHGGGGSVLTFKNGKDYQRAIVFMLSWPHGFPRIMSSYKFSEHWHGPPADANYNTQDPTFKADGTCESSDTVGWVCEHRWRPIKNMVQWRNEAGSQAVENFWGDYDRMAFSRGNSAYIAMSRGGSTFDEQRYTGLPKGEYCNLAVVDYDSNAQSCTGNDIVDVDDSGHAHINTNNDENMVIIHVGATKNGPIVEPTIHPTQPSTEGPTQKITQGPTQGPGPTSPAGWERTVIFVEKATQTGQLVALRGGIDGSQRSGCNNNNADTDECAIPITHNIDGQGTEFGSWKEGDDFLDWHGPENDQGNHNGQSAYGTPMVWTTNDPNYSNNVAQHGYGYTDLNQWGEHYWMVDIQMDCSKTEGGWFELKAVLNGQWENDCNQPTCEGSASDTTRPYTTGNHFARCGYLNVFHFNSDHCQIDNL
ncbi:alpha-amylase-like [Lytechinus variegatus]|uniref:alpha-amylase-like n=1 Tax=Lytechinus variegatus TaxID=7654 RepID=UPI001BB19992|nr:alpha-amylase-like [Lytechinus variegatus]